MTSNRLAKQLVDLGGLAPEVIARRMAYFATGSFSGSSGRRRELTRMTSEKFEAAWLSWMAMGMELAQIQWSAFSWIWSIWAPTQNRQDLLARYDQIAAQVAAAGLVPYVRIAKGNRARLSRKGR